MSQDSLEDFLAVASELRVGGIGFDSREDNNMSDSREDNSIFDSREDKHIFGSREDNSDHQDRGRTSLQPGSIWAPNIEERQNFDLDNLQNRRQRSDNGQSGRNYEYSETLAKANVMQDGGAMLEIEKEEVGEIAKKGGKKKRHYDYLRDPIRVKANDRTGKVNTNTLRILLLCFVFFGFFC